MWLTKKLVFIFLIAILLGGSFISGFYWGKLKTEPKIIFGVANAELGQPPAADFSLFWNVWSKLQEKYVDQKSLDWQNMVYGAISGMVNSLGDPYTVFLKPNETKSFLEDIKGTFGGIGAEIGKKKNQIVIIAPLEGTPAQRAGLRAGDKIIKIDEIAVTAETSVDEAVKLIRGEKNTEVILTILRQGWETPREIKIIRDLIKIPSLRWELKEETIAYIKIFQFSERVGLDFRRIAVDILNSPADKIILDLRNNPGGYLEMAQEIAGWFLEKGRIVTIEDFGNDKKKKEYRAEGSAAFKNYPIVVLINNGSASASEILAGALRDNLGIKIVGEKSFGKGSVQGLEKLKDESSLKITVANWLTPKGELISEKGLEPDIKVEMKEEDYQEGKDPQLDKAIEIIKRLN